VLGDATVEDEKAFCLVYFDEAHTLCGNPSVNDKRERSEYHNLGKVLSLLFQAEHKIFFLFLSTNSRLSALVPPTHSHPSARSWIGTRLLPPYTELPFDVFGDQVISQLKQTNSLFLNDVCQTKEIIKFGRPLFVTFHLSSHL
jgi:hypothetical protein